MGKFCLLLFINLIFAIPLASTEQSTELEQWAGQPRPIRENKYPDRHVRILDREGKYKLEWAVDWPGQRIQFNVTVKTRGWVGLGLSKNGKMAGADMVMGGVTSKGKVYFSDRYGRAGRRPVYDKQQNWENDRNLALERGAYTFLSFSRALDTCDSDQDIPITEDTLFVLWAYGRTDNISQPHDSKRGSIKVYLTDQDHTPRAIQEAGQNTPSRPTFADSSDKLWSIKANLTVPAKRTTYWCRIHKRTFPQKHHMTGFHFKYNNATFSNIHHMIFFRCMAPNAAELLDKYVDHPGEECYIPQESLGEIPHQTCTEMKAGYSYGAGPIFLPENVGYPMGDLDRVEYYMTQTHYDNPTLRDDLYVENQLDIYYSSDLRPNDGGLMTIGHRNPGAPSFLLPPKETDHDIFGHCSPACTTKMFPPEGIHVVGCVLHAHFAKEITLHHFRGEQELPYILKDDNWQFNYQSGRMVRGERHVLPGDHISVRCNFDTTSKNQSTTGGYSTDQEMCLTFFTYYPLLKDYMACWSFIRSREYQARYLAGTLNTEYDQDRLEFVATSPGHVAGMTVREISDSKYVDWNPEQRENLRRDHLIHPMLDVCPTLEQIQDFVDNGTTPLPVTFTKYPVEAIPYEEPKGECSLS